MSKDEIWLEHWMCVSRVSEKAEALIESVGGKVVHASISHTYSSPIVLVCFLYDDPPDDDQGYSIKEESGVLRIEASSANTLECNLVVYSKLESDYVAPVVQQSVTDLVMITQGEWFKMDEVKRSHQQLKESYRAVSKNREKPWLSFDEDGE